MRSKTVTKPIRTRRPYPGGKTQVRGHSVEFRAKYEVKTALKKYKARRKAKAQMTQVSRRKNRANS